MPRIRSIKPEFWGDEKLAPMPVIDRLVFLGLISMADDAGRLVDSLKSVDGFIFPETNETAEDSLARLAETGRIHRYESSSGQRLIQIANWKKHQKIDHPSKYTLPGPSRRTRESLAEDSRLDLGSTISTSTNDQDLGAEKYLGRESRASGSESSGRSTLADAVAQLPAAAVEFLGWAWPRSRASGTTRAQKARELLATLNGGTSYKGQRVQAFTPERLAAKCREVMTEDVRDRSKAMAVLLMKLGDTSDGSAPGRVAAAAAQREEQHDAGEKARALVHANAWLEDHPEIETAIAAQLVADGFPADLGDDDVRIVGRRIAREAHVLTAWRDAGAPMVAADDCELAVVPGAQPGAQATHPKGGGDR